MSEIIKHKLSISRQTLPWLVTLSLFLTELLARAGEGGGKASSVDIEGASFSIF